MTLKGKTASDDQWSVTPSYKPMPPTMSLPFPFMVESVSVTVVDDDKNTNNNEIDRPSSRCFVTPTSSFPFQSPPTLLVP